MQRKKISCWQCKFFVPTGFVYDAGIQGKCFRYPPTVNTDQVRPYVFEKNWCGEFKQKRYANQSK